MEEIKGYVENIIYRNVENGYTVLELDCDDELITCTGLFNDIGEGELLEAKGEYVINPSYGRQFQMKQYEVHAPEDVRSMERYLASGAVKGIGPALADRIIRRFGEDTFRIIEEEPERLAEIKGISEKKAREIAEQMEGKKDVRNVMMYLQQYGITYALALKMYKQYGQQIYDVLQKNPYKLAEDIQGIGFHIADEIARKIGIEKDSDYRIRSGLLYTLILAVRNGNMYLPYEELVQNCEELLGLVVFDDMERHILDLCIEKKLYIQEKEGVRCVYSAQNYFLELNVARMLTELNVTCHTDEEDVLKKIDKLEQEDGMKLDEMQRNAVLEAVKQGLLIITGGPGTGKTTTIKTIIRYFEAEGFDILLAAPTGRAAKRMTETTGYEAQTVHRMLELSGGFEDAEVRAEFGRNEQNPLEADVIIIDETSMMDIFLMYSLLRAVLVGTRLIFVGDVNQLPSVGPGCVLRDMIESSMLKVVALTKIFRQAMQSDIILNAHKINRGDRVVLDNKSKDFFFLSRMDTVLVQRVVLALVQEKMPKYVNVSPFEVQVLTPTRKGALGVIELNRMLQKYLNPPSKDKTEKETASGLFREGDKVMQIKNNYQLEWEVVNQYNIPIDKGMGVFNGDVGVIQHMNEYTETMQVLFDDGRKVNYSYKQLEELELAYAITIHKSQGSEYPAVVIPLLNGPRMLMNRNLLYTAVTRARSCVTVVGSEEVFQSMIKNVSENKRYTGLRYALSDFPT